MNVSLEDPLFVQLYISGGYEVLESILKVVYV